MKNFDIRTTFGYAPTYHHPGKQDGSGAKVEG
jgi:hypothetical protein